MPDNRSRQRPAAWSRRRVVAAGAATTILLALGVAATLTVAGRRAPQVVDSAGEPLTPQEIAEVKAAVEKQGGCPCDTSGRTAGGGGGLRGRPRRGRAAYRVKKTGDGWKVIGSFLAFST
jgi:hypothetical protein